jgi:hypothetical protein
VTPWEQVREALREILAAHPRAVQGYPMLEVDTGREPPFSIRFAPWAADIAGDLHRQVGGYVKLRVGVFPFPLPSDATVWGRARPESIPAGEADIEITLEDSLVVQSGHPVTGTILVLNRSDRAISGSTNGASTAVVVHPQTSQPVGGYSGAQRRPGVTFTAAPDETARIPLLVGTASFLPALGYAVPPGEWAVSADLRLDDARVLRTPDLPLTIR